MIGIDTSFLIALQNADHRLHFPAQKAVEEHRGEGFAIAPQVVSEFVHVVTDPNRFPAPATMMAALGAAMAWWDSKEAQLVVPDKDALQLFNDWMRELLLGRKQVLDTLLAATYKCAGISLIASTNFRDFGRYPGIHPLTLR
jgi:predicted nucleic acid-binding protein